MSTIYTIDTIENILIPSNVPKVLKPILNTPIYVKYEDWKECISKISERCCLKWVAKRQYGKERPEREEDHNNSNNPEVLFSKSFTCHRAGKYRQKREGIKRNISTPSKKCGCKATFKITQKTNQPHIMIFFFKNDHVNHIPGDQSDIKRLGLSKHMSLLIKDQLKEGKSCSDIRIFVHQLLKQQEQQQQQQQENENHHHDHIVQKIPNYDDVYNLCKKLKLEKNVSSV